VTTTPLDLGTLAPLSPALVVAPHPDDESLGCGGLVALLHDAGVEIHALLVSDGSASHPGSRRFDADARRALRDVEWREALACLGVAATSLHRLGCRDGDVPAAGDPRTAPVIRDLRAVVDAIGPKLVLLPWRRDPHVDHRASHSLVRAALAGRRPAPRCLEYVVWIDERGTAGDWPRPGEALSWTLDIAAARARKRLAVAAHRSQHGKVIVDDPNGFVIAPEMRRRAEGPREHFFEVEDWK
jgi:LmbE family N-acetylglucosaminyl deacetylase